MHLTSVSMLHHMLLTDHLLLILQTQVTLLLILLTWVMVYRQEVLVFLRHDPQDDLHFLVGMGQGKIDVDVGSDRLVKESSTPTHHHVLRLSPKTSLSKPPVALSALVDKILMLIATAPSMRNQLPSTSK